MPGFEPLAQAASKAIGPLLRDSPMSPAKLEFVWKLAVGPAMDRGTFVRLEGDKLLVEAKTAAWANEVTRASHLILKRLQGLLGPDVVTELIVRV